MRVLGGGGKGELKCMGPGMEVMYECECCMVVEHSAGCRLGCSACFSCMRTTADAAISF